MTAKHAVGPMRAVPAFAVGLAIVLAGCVSVEKVGRPPSPAEIGRINDAAISSSTFHLRYAPDATTFLAGPPAGCSGGGCGVPAATDPTSVAAADASHLTLYLRDGQRATLPLDDVEGIQAGRNRTRGAVIGAGVAAGVMLGAVAILLVGAAGAPGEHGSPPGLLKVCEAKCEEAVAVLGLSSALVGGLLGAAIGTPHVFQFGDAK